jgi:hypothetical protein
MERQVSSELDRTFALMLVRPGSGTVHSVIREVRALEAQARSEGNDEAAAALNGLCRDALALHDSVVTLESDPEIVKRNMLARIITAVFPVLNGLDSFRNFPKKPLWELFMSGLSVAAEISTATQYLESANLAARAHFERDLVKIEDRVMELASSEGMDISEVRPAVEGYFDSLRKAEVPTTQKPMVPFILWLVICTVSYKRSKTVLGAE